MSRSEFRPDDSHLDPARTLEQYQLAGFPPDLALDLVLNELVVRAAQATGASAAALALVRGEEMVCRAATGTLAPDLGVPLNTRDGLSGACFQTRRPQLSLDAEFDPRVDPAVSQRHGIRSILIVPVFDRVDKDPNDKDSNDKNAEVSGVLEAFSCSPAAFSDSDQKLLEDFAEECARIRRAAIELSQRPVASPVVFPEIVLPQIASESNPSALVPPVFTPPEGIADSPLPTSRPPHESWTLVLATLTILAALTVSFLIGSRIGWLRSGPTQAAQPIPTETASAKSCVGAAAPGCPTEPSSAAAPAFRRAHRPASETSSEKTSAKASRQTPTHSAAPAEDELVVFEKGKVIFRMKPAPAKPAQATSQQVKPESTKPAGDGIVEASSTTKIDTTKIPTTKIAPSQSVWLSPAQAETRLLSRTEPQYPAEALAAHRAGDVVLEVQVAEDGSVSNIRTLSGDPALAAAAAEAVRNWRYQPYHRHDRPAQFQTDVTLTFTLPN